MAAGGRLRDAGHVGRPHGLDGSFHIRDAKDEFAEGTPVTVDGSERLVERRAGTDSAPVVRLAGVADREAAAALTGKRLEVAEAAAPLEEGEWMAGDLIGCQVAGAGKVTRVVAGPSCDVLELDDGTLVPLVGDAIKSIDPVARRIEIDRHFLGLA